ncbi:MAG: hypothetical protein WC869_16655 [Phycisphaerae bacterium]|jgi:hypothetical protein
MRRTRDEFPNRPKGYRHDLMHTWCRGLTPKEQVLVNAQELREKKATRVLVEQAAQVVAAEPVVMEG